MDSLQGLKQTTKKEKPEKHKLFLDDIARDTRSNKTAYIHQGCALSKITRSPKVANYKIQVAQYKAYIKIKVAASHQTRKMKYEK